MNNNEYNDVTPESLLEAMKDNGDIDEISYNEMKYRFEDIEDVHKLSDYQIYEKAFQNNRSRKCAEVLLEMAERESYALKKSMLLSNCLKNPLGRKFSEKEYKKSMLILHEAIRLAGERDYSKQAIVPLIEMYLYTQCFFLSNQANTKRLNENQFSQYSLSKQLRIICIYIQDQSRLMKQELFNNRKKGTFITGMEMNIADKSIKHAPNEKVSYKDNFEGTLEYFDTLISYIYYAKRKELETDDTAKHGDIHPFQIPEFEELMYIAQQRRMYEQLEEKFRYGEWTIWLEKDKYNQDIYVFAPKYKEKYKAHLVASIRREYQFTTNIMRDSVNMRTRAAWDSTVVLASQIDLDCLECFRASKELYIKACEIAKLHVEVYRGLTKRYYFECKFNNISIEDYIQMYIFLYTFSQIYITAMERTFDQNENASYKYLVPVISMNYLVEEFSRLHDINKEKTKELLKNYVYDKKTKDGAGDIFSRPLIKVCKDKVLLCESLIEQMNIERCVENVLHNYKVDLSPVGKQFEKKLIEQLKVMKSISVNTNSIQFIAFDGRDVEFDFLGRLEDCLLLFEFKSVLIPYDEYEVHKREEIIKEGVEQVKRRSDIIQHDWDKISSLANIELPETPYPDNKIIKVVCTNVYNYTTLKIEGVRITDESTLLKYFTDPFVTLYSTDSEMTEILETEFIWKAEKPTVEEFIAYLDNPVTVANIPECLEEEMKMIPTFKGDCLIAFKDTFLAKDPFKEVINKKRTIIKEKKIYPNDLCPCGSGKKYKNCCRI